MTDTTKHYIFIGGALVIGVIVVYVIVKHAEASGAASQAAQDQATANNLSGDTSLLDELAYASQYPAQTANETAVAGSVQNPNFASDLEQSIAILQQMGLAPSPAPAAPAPAPANSNSQTIVPVVKQPQPIQLETGSGGSDYNIGNGPKEVL